MEPLPNLELCLRLCFEARDGAHPCGVALASFFPRAKTRGRRRSELEPELIFPPKVREMLGADGAITRACDGSSWRQAGDARPTVPLATREWLAEAALSLGRAEGPEVMWALLRAMTELENLAHNLTAKNRTQVREVLHGVDARMLRAEPFAALLVRVLKVSQLVYAAFRLGGFDHEDSWHQVEDRLWSPHPTGRGDERGSYLPSLVQAASGHGRDRMRRKSETGRTTGHAQALLARFAAGPGASLWPWRDAEGKLLPQQSGSIDPDVAASCFFVLLTHVADQRRARGGPSAGLPAPFAEAGFSAAEWLPDRTDDLAIRLLAASGNVRTEMLESVPQLLRATLSAKPGDPSATRLPALLRWLEENGRELLETA